MGREMQNIPRNFPNAEDLSANVIGYHSGGPAGVEFPVLQGIIDISTNAIKICYVNSFEKNILLTKLVSKELSAITHGSANLKLSVVAKATAIGSRTVIKTVAVQTNLDGDSAFESAITTKPLLKPGDTLVAEITDGLSASGTLGLTVNAVEIASGDATNFD